MWFRPAHVPAGRVVHARPGYRGRTCAAPPVAACGDRNCLLAQVSSDGAVRVGTPRYGLPALVSSDGAIRVDTPRRGLPADGDLAARVPASGRSRGDRGARLDPVSRHGRAQADRARLRASAAPELSRLLGAPVRAPARGRVARARDRLRDARHGRGAGPLPDAVFPRRNAMAIGARRPIVVVQSELVQLLDAPQRRAVFAHEAAHILADHQLYRTALAILVLTDAQCATAAAAGARAHGADGVGARHRAERRPRRRARHARPARRSAAR